MSNNRIPDWYLADVAHCLRNLWTQARLTNEQLAHAHRAYLAAAPTESEPTRSEPTGWPSGVSVSLPRQQGCGW